jgi:2'-hydroxyisoflavone reductase
MFNRGRTNQHLYPQVERLQGDRDGNLDALRGRQWDVVIDTCGYVPRVVRQSAELLADAVARYVFISTISVYADPLVGGADEDAPLASLADSTVEEITGESYGGLKVLCERAVQDIYAERALIIRPGLIVGPHDPTHRFTYWVTRTAQGGQVLAPDDRSAPVQVIDVRDLAEWTMRMAQDGGGVYNATGPAAPLTLGETLETCKQVAQEHTGTAAEFVWAAPQFLLDQGVAPWSDIPLWVAGDDALNQVSIARALAQGMALRPLAVTIADTLAWALGEQPVEAPRAGLSSERETQLLNEWLNHEL